MVAFKEGFSARTVPPMGSGNQLPISPKEGWNVVITGSSVEPTQSDPSNGKLVLNMVIIDGELMGQVGDDNLNIFHSNPKTCEIADQQLSSYCWAVGKPDARQSEELYNTPFKVVVTKNPKDDKYVNVKPLCVDGRAPGKVASESTAGAPASHQPAPPPPSAPAPTPPPAATGAPAWTPPGAAAAQPPASGQPAWGGAPPAGSPTPPWSQPK